MIPSNAIWQTRSLDAGPVNARATTVQKVVIVSGNPDTMALAETALEAGHYDVVFVESIAHAYSQIKRIQPNLVILCLRLDDPGGFRVLSMLQLDPDTRRVPVLTYAASQKLRAGSGDADEDNEATGFFEASDIPALMN